MATSTSLDPSAAVGLLPGQMNGYLPQGKDGVFDRDTLFKLIDGGAEVYRALNIRLAVSRRYARKDSPDIIVDVFDMGDSKDAYGAFHIDMREGKSAGIGRESEYMGGSLAFWKDRFFVSVVALAETGQTRKTVLDLGRAVARKITGKGGPPDLLAWLPAEGMLKSQVHYFHDWPSLNRLFFLAQDNLLGLDQKTEGILARYREAVIFIVRYHSTENAQTAVSRILKDYLPEANQQGIARTENGKWTGFARRANVVIGVLDAPSENKAQRLISEVKKP